jgi:nucleoside-diphosphate-sugar epimerase
MKSAIVTGAAGFLGSHLVEKLIREGFFVLGVDNFSTGSRSNETYLKKSYSSEQFQFVEADVVSDWTWARQIKNLEFVFHFASPASPPLYQKLAIETIHVNTIGLENAIKFADLHKARVVFASTSEVYGDPAVSPQPESYWGHVNSFGERSCYDEAKRCGEAIIFSYNARNKTKHGMVRIFNTYGPRMNPHDGRVVINFLVQALKKESLTVYGDGSQTRSFCFVDDLINGIFAYAKTGLNYPVNLGNPNEFTILELAQKVQKQFADSKLQISFMPLPKDDPKQRRPDITIATKILSPWKPTVQLAEGLIAMTNWLKEISI